MNLLKQQIIRQFGRHVNEYREHATMQKRAAESLAKRLLSLSTEIPRAPVLEIGCGTGAVTRHLLEICSSNPIVISDLCPIMLSDCRQQFLETKTDASFQVMDGEEIIHPNAYGLIISGMTFQWFFNLEKTIENLYGSLKAGGFLLFSFMEAETFPEWKEACRQADVPFTGHLLPSVASVSAILNRLASDFQLDREAIPLQLCRPLAIFSSPQIFGLQPFKFAAPPDH